MSEAVPGEVVEAAVRVCGTAFYSKDQLRGALVAAGVPGDHHDRWRSDDASKYVIARHVFHDLAARGPAGQDILRRVVVELASMTRPDPAAPDQQTAAGAVEDLKALAMARRLLVDADAADRVRRQQAQDRLVAASRARQESLAALADRLRGFAQSTDSPQRRGYALERLLVDLFAAFELLYRPSYRLAHEQIDGAFEHRSFTYLVEARWRAAPPGAGDLADFKMKVDGKLESTRGVFVSMAGYDTAVVECFMATARGTRNNLLSSTGRTSRWSSRATCRSPTPSTTRSRPGARKDDGGRRSPAAEPVDGRHGNARRDRPRVRRVLGQDPAPGR